MTKDCGNHHDGGGGGRRIATALGALLITFAFIIFLVWAILQPHAPKFILQDATIYAFNLSQPNSININMQITVSSHNPNRRIGIFYEKLDIYASYHNQQITLPTLLPSSYQGHKDITVWSPYLYGNSVPVSPFLGSGLGQELNSGIVMMNVKLDGRVKWKVGTWISGKYHININCPAYIAFGDRSKGVSVGPAIKYQLVQRCNVEVSAG